MHTTSVWLADTLELERLTGTEAATPVFSGLLTGVVYKSTRGPRAMALAGTIGIGVSCTYWYAGSYLYNVVLGRNGKF